jgi:hypothetical protein
MRRTVEVPGADDVGGEHGGVEQDK